MPPNITSPANGATVTYVRGVDGVSAGYFVPALTVTTDTLADSIICVSSTGSFYSADNGGTSFVVTFLDTEPDLGPGTLTITAYDPLGDPGDSVEYILNVVAPSTIVGSRSQSVNRGGVGRMGRSGVANAG